MIDKPIPPKPQLIKKGFDVKYLGFPFFKRLYGKIITSTQFVSVMTFFQSLG